MPSLVNGSPFSVTFPSGVGTTGKIDFSQNMQGISGAAKNRNPLGFSGAILAFKNDTDSGLTITFQPSNQSIFLAPGDTEPVPVMWGDVFANWNVVYQNSFQVHDAELLSVVFYTPADIKAGFQPLAGGGSVNPPATNQAQSIIGDFISSHDLLGSNLQAYNPGVGLSSRIVLITTDGTVFYNALIAETNGTVTFPKGFQFGNLLTGLSISAISIFSGSGNGAVNHNLGKTPNFATISPTSARSDFFVGSYTSTQVTVSMTTPGAYRGLAIAT